MKPTHDGATWGRGAARERCTVEGCARFALPYGFPLHDEQLCRGHLYARLREKGIKHAPPDAPRGGTSHE